MCDIIEDKVRELAFIAVCLHILLLEFQHCPGFVVLGDSAESWNNIVTSNHTSRQICKERKSFHRFSQFRTSWIFLNSWRSEPGEMESGEEGGYNLLKLLIGQPPGPDVECCASLE